MKNAVLMMVVVSLFVCISQVHGQEIFATDFESGNLAEWTDVHERALVDLIPILLWYCGDDCFRLQVEYRVVGEVEVRSAQAMCQPPVDCRDFHAPNMYRVWVNFEHLSQTTEWISILAYTEELPET